MQKQKNENWKRAEDWKKVSLGFFSFAVLGVILAYSSGYHNGQINGVNQGRDAISNASISYHFIAGNSLAPYNCTMSEGFVGNTLVYYLNARYTNNVIFNNKNCLVADLSLSVGK